jgi:hypothetical protein
MDILIGRHNIGTQTGVRQRASRHVPGVECTHLWHADLVFALTHCATRAILDRTRISSRSAAQVVIAVSASQIIVARTAFENVITNAAQEQIITATTD